MREIRANFKGAVEDFKLDVDFTIPSTGITALFGPSGCGKTTVLRCIAGLHRLEAGILSIGNTVWQNEKTFLPPHLRPLGYVFQEPSLFPHLNVNDNLTYGLKRSRSVSPLISFQKTVELLGLSQMLNRQPANLSGGEKQRVAIGRALLTNPELLLMDEPLSALDHRSKNEIIPYLEILKNRLQIPMLYVSHDIREIERMADRIIMLENGSVKACAPLSEILLDPSCSLSEQHDAAIVFEGEISRFDPSDNLTTITVNGGNFLIPGKVGREGTKKRLRIFANDVSLSPEEPSRTTILNILPATITKITPIGEAQVNIICQLGENGIKIPARITSRSQKYFNFQQDNKIYIQIKGVSLLNT